MNELYITVFQMIATILMSLDYFSKKKYIKKYNDLFCQGLNNIKKREERYAESAKSKYNKNKYNNLFYFIIYLIFFILFIYILMKYDSYNMNISSFKVILILMLLSEIFIFIYVFKNMEYIVERIQRYIFNIPLIITKLFSKKSSIAGFGLMILLFSFVIKILIVLEVPLKYTESFSLFFSLFLLIIIFDISYKLKNTDIYIVYFSMILVIILMIPIIKHLHFYN